MEVTKTTLKQTTKREKVTLFHSKNQDKSLLLWFVSLLTKQRQSLFTEKNNAWQQWNASALKYALSRSNLGDCQSISDVPPNSCFCKYYHCIRFTAKAT